jgi:hypothetical protein
VDEAVRVSALAQFYVAEYTAMMDSVSVWKTLQYALWPILLGAWLLLGEFSTKMPKYMAIWGAALVLPLGYLAYQAAAIDALSGVLLIERDLRPLAAALVGTDQFWLHERVYRTSRPQSLLWNYAAWPPVLCFGLAFVALAYRRTTERLSWKDWLGFTLCLLFSVWVTLLTIDERQLHRQIDAVVAKSSLPTKKTG